MNYEENFLMFLCFISLTSILLAQDRKDLQKTIPVFLGVMKGNIKEYLPLVQVVDVFYIQNASTSGIVSNIPQHLVDETFAFAEKFKKYAIEVCTKRGATAPAIDNFEVKFTMIGQYQTNILIEA